MCVGLAEASFNLLSKLGNAIMNVLYLIMKVSAVDSECLCYKIFIFFFRNTNFCVSASADDFNVKKFTKGLLRVISFKGKNEPQPQPSRRLLVFCGRSKQLRLHH